MWKKTKANEKIDSLLGENTIFKGEIEIQGDLRIDGKLEGKIKADCVIIGEKADIKAEIKTKTISISGRVEGKIIATHLATIEAKGQVYGEIMVQKIAIVEGGIFEGRCTRLKEKETVVESKPDFPGGAVAVGMRSKIPIYIALVCCLTVLITASIMLGYKVLCLKNRASSLEQEVASLMEAKTVKLCTVTVYGPSGRQYDSTPRIAASGKIPKPGTVAVSHDLFYSGWVFGSRIYIEGLGVHKVNDLMHPGWENRIDVFLGSERLARRFGRREVRVVLLEGEDNLFTKR